MKYYFAKHQDGSITSCNFPIQETEAESFAFEVEEAEVEAVNEGTKDWDITDGVLTTKPSTRKADKEAAQAAMKAQKEADKAIKEALKAKMEAGTATLEDIQAALTKLL